LRRSFAKPSNTRKLKRDVTTTGVVTAACLAAASPISIAIAQQTGPLMPLTVESKQARKKTTPAPAKKAGVAPAAPVVAAQPPPSAPPGANPYANPEAPYEVVKSANGKFPEPLVDTPKTITAVPAAVLEDKSIRDLQEFARGTPGLTIGSAEGGNAFGAFAIRGFKANNDIFVDSIRNPGNVIPDFFATQQVEIYKGPSGGVAGRSTIGGAVNIISKQPDLTSSFYEVTTTLGTDHTFRTTVDVNQKVTPNFAFRANLMYDQHDVAGRDITESERWGGLLSATAKLSDSVKVTLDYYRYRNNAIPDWGVPVRDIDNVPVTELGFSRKLWVGMQGLDFFEERADIVTGTVVAKLTEGLTLTNRSRAGQSELDYVATSMEGYPDVHHPNRDQVAGIYANQTELNVRFNTGGIRHNVVAGVDVTRETIDRFPVFAGMSSSKASAKRKPRHHSEM
jgi:catecholate siderophore receptor